MILAGLLLFLAVFLIAWCAEEESFGAGLLALVCTFIASLVISEGVSKQQHVAEGRAEWVQVVNESGSVKNEFRWKEFDQ